MSRKRDRKSGGEPGNAPPGATAGRARTWTFRLVAVVLGPVLALLLLEGGLRLFGYGYPTTIAVEVPGRDEYAMNLRYGWRFFPRATARSPLLFHFAKEKPAGTYRIFVLGASAAQGYPEPVFGFSRQLELMLERTWPATDFEVINTAIAATNSHTVLCTARECARYEPDLFIVYLGNNEVIGPYGLGSSRSEGHGGLGLIRAGIRLRATRLGQAVDELATKLRGEDETVENWKGMETFTERHIPLGDPRLERIYDDFARNLADICAAADDRDVPVLLATVPVNDWDAAPFASAHRADLPAADLETWDEAAQEAAAAEAAGDSVAAIAAWERAVAIDDAHAESRYRLGRLLLAAGDTTAAHAHVCAARELDLLRFRADDRINAAIRETAADPRFRHVSLADVAEDFAALGPDLDRPRLQRRFLEHVHPTFAGNYAFAAEIFRHVAGLLPAEIRDGGPADPAPPSRVEVAEAAPWTPWGGWKMVSTVQVLMSEPPFPGRYDHAVLTADWAAAANELRALLSAGAIEGAVQRYGEVVEAHPEDLILRAAYADLLRATNRHDAASWQWRYIEERLPPADWAE